MPTLFNSDYLIDTLSFTSALTTVTTGSPYSIPSALIDNTFASGRSRVSATLVLNFSTPLTAGTGSPYITLFPMALPDGLTYPSPPGNAAAAPSANAYQIVYQANASTAFSSIVFRAIDLEPAKYAFQFYNQSGVSWTGGGTITATLYRYSPEYY